MNSNYPPQRPGISAPLAWCRVVSLTMLLMLPLAASAQLVPRSSALGGGDRPRPLPMEQAFPYFVSLTDTSQLHVTWQIAPEHYLYRHQFDFFLRDPDSGESLPLPFELPPGKAKSDQFFGDIEAYYDQVTASVTVDSSDLPAGATLVIQYQGCAEWGFCYPPQSSDYLLDP